METTLLLLKPDALHRGLTGRILARFEQKGLQIVGLKMMQMTQELAAKHYAEHVEKPFYNNLVSFMTASPLVAIALRGPEAIGVARNLMGATFGIQADAGTIRGDFGSSKSYNLIHGSDSQESAKRELDLFFPEGLNDWTPISTPWLWDNE